MIEYPSQFPIPLRAPFAVDHDFLTIETPMQGGYILQRRIAPDIFRQVSLVFTMSMEEFHAWWDWAQRYGWSWHSMVIRGTTYTMRYIADVDFAYADFATVRVSVTAEHTIEEDGEFWDEETQGAPTLYDFGVTDAPASDNTGGATLAFDFKTSFEVQIITLAATQEDYIFGTSANTQAISTFVALSDANITLEIHDHPVTTLLASTDDISLRWHHDASVTNSLLQLDPNTAYTLRIIGQIGDEVSLWGFTR